MALFYIFLFYDRTFLHVCNLEENLLFSTLILGSVFSDYVFYGVYKCSQHLKEKSYKATVHPQLEYCSTT